ncbi:hypothetical protein AJ87_19360 [Rhizobium yanglingense]|nr:hypothetical protein AJ87_19360 [Rhizobium yanglingense]
MPETAIDHVRICRSSVPLAMPLRIEIACCAFLLEIASNPAFRFPLTGATVVLRGMAPVMIDSGAEVCGTKPIGLTSGTGAPVSGSGEAALLHAAAARPRVERINTAFFIRDTRQENMPRVSQQAS